MEKYGFVYIWYDRKRKMYYVGCHWGTEDDGYICSSKRMHDARRNRPHDFRRKIIQKGIPRETLLEEEFKWLQMIKDEELGKKYYNFNKHHHGHWANDPNSKLSVGQKISKNHSNPEVKKKLSDAKLGDKNPMKRQEVIQKRSQSWKYTGWNNGLVRSEDQKQKHSEFMKGKPSPMKGNHLSDEAKKKLSKYWIITSPDGSEEIVQNLNDYCLNHKDKLSAYNLRSVAYGFKKTHKGYMCRKQGS